MSKAKKSVPAKKPAAKAPAKPAVKAAKLVPKGETRNGVTQPKADAMCRDIWSHLDARKAAGKDYSFADMRKIIDPATADATLKTQTQRWRTFNRLKGKSAAIAATSPSHAPR